VYSVVRPDDSARVLDRHLDELAAADLDRASSGSGCGRAPSTSPSCWPAWTDAPEDPQSGFVDQLNSITEIGEPLKTIPAEILQPTSVACARRLRETVTSLVPAARMPAFLRAAMMQER
jgi:hypothetical protein